MQFHITMNVFRMSFQAGLSQLLRASPPSPQCHLNKKRVHLLID